MVLINFLIVCAVATAIYWIVNCSFDPPAVKPKLHFTPATYTLITEGGR